MQAHILEFPSETFDVATNKEVLTEHDQRITALETRLNLHGPRGLSKPSPWTRMRKHIIEHKATDGIAILISIAVIVGGGYFMRHLEKADHYDDMHTNELIDAKTKSLGESISSQGERLAKIEGKLDAILAMKGISDSARHAKNGSVELAVKDAKEAHAALIAASTAKVPAPPEYFEDSTQDLDDLSRHSASNALSDLVHSLRLALAQYRSALTPSPDLQLYSFKPMPHAMYLARKTGIDGGAFDLRTISEDAIVPKDAPSTLQDAPTIKGAILWGGMQTLDDIRWANVTFVNTRIAYNGGLTELQNVRFINCTFQNVTPSPHSDQILKYAALGQSSLTIG